MLELLKPLDIILFDAEPYSFLHKLISWRSLDSAVHCVIVKDIEGNLYDPDFKGIVISNISNYIGRSCQILRYTNTTNNSQLQSWCDSIVKTNTGYDYFQWFFGFVLGLYANKLADSDTKWTCAELPYWMFQQNGYKLTDKEEILPMPRLFRYHKDFYTIYRGLV